MGNSVVACASVYSCRSILSLAGDPNCTPHQSHPSQPNPEEMSTSPVPVKSLQDSRKPSREPSTGYLLEHHLAQFASTGTWSLLQRCKIDCPKEQMPPQLTPTCTWWKVKSLFLSTQSSSIPASENKQVTKLSIELREQVRPQSHSHRELRAVILCSFHLHCGLVIDDSVHLNWESWVLGPRCDRDTNWVSACLGCGACTATSFPAETSAHFPGSFLNHPHQN